MTLIRSQTDASTMLLNLQSWELNKLPLFINLPALGIATATENGLSYHFIVRS